MTHEKKPRGTVRAWLQKGKRQHFQHWKATLSYFRRGQSQREAQLRRFFIEPRLKKIVRDGVFLSQIGVVCLLLGALPILIGQFQTLEGGAGCLLLLLALLALPGIVSATLGLTIVIAAKSFHAVIARPPDPATVQQWLHESIHRLRTHSLAKLGLSEDEVADFHKQPPIVTPILWHSEGIQTSDLVWRFEPNLAFFGVYRVVILQLAAEHLGIYLCDFNFLRDVSLNDETYELSYQDVVTLKTKELSSSRTLPTGQKLNHEQSYELTVSGGCSIHLGTSIPRLGTQLNEDALPETNTEAAIAGIRANIRDRKLALTRGHSSLAMPAP